jgi:ketosteroid isomerase-like protein
MRTIKLLFCLLLICAVLSSVAMAQESVASLLSKASDAYKQQKYERAAELYDNAIKQGAQGLTLVYNAACAFALAGKRDEAGVGTAARGRGTKAIQDARTEQAVRRLEREWLDAGHNKDVAAMDRILADNFIITFGDGTVRDKAEVMRRLRMGTKNPNECEWTEDSEVRVNGNTAIIVGRYRYRLREKDKETVTESRYTDTYIRRKGHWQVVASHLSDIGKK